VRIAKGRFNDSDVWKSRRWAPVSDTEMAQRIVPSLQQLPRASEFNAH
jgi:hypothetical protein